MDESGDYLILEEKNQNLLRNTTTKPQVIRKISRLMQQLMLQTHYSRKRGKVIHSSLVLNLRILTQPLRPTSLV